MAEPTEATAAAAPEPSMEEILASIRKIIADDKPPEPEPEVLELTQLVQEDGSVVDLTPAAAETPLPEPVMIPEPPSLDNLISEQTASAAKSSLEALANTVEIERVASHGYTPLGNGAQTVEGMVLELLRPMLKQWLDQNLPATVERIVQKEVEKIAKRLKD